MPGAATRSSGTSNAPAASCLATSTTRSSRSRRGTTRRIGRLGVLATRGRIGDHRRRRHRRTLLPPRPHDGSLPRAVLQALLPRRLEQPARLGTLRGVAAQRLRPADRRLTACRDVHGVPGAPLRQARRSSLFIDAGSVAAAAWDVELKELRYDVGPGLRYLTPIGPDPRRLRLPAQSDSRPDRRRRARVTALAHPLQPGTGVLMRPWARRIVKTPGGIVAGAWSLLVAARARRDADGLVPRLGARDSANGRPRGCSTGSSRSAGSTAICGPARRSPTSASRRTAARWCASSACA